MPKLTIAPAAQNDLEEIWRYIAEDNESAAEKLIRQLIGKFELLTNNQLIGTTQDDFPIDMRMFPF